MKEGLSFCAHFSLLRAEGKALSVGEAEGARDKRAANNKGAVRCALKSLSRTRVKAAIEKSVVNRNMSDMVLKMEIPMETVTEVTESGVMKEVERKVFPGYVLIKMILTDDTWHLIRNIRGVTGFVGEANKAIPLTEEEVAALGVEKHEIVVLYNVGDTVKITDGPLASFMGTVEEIDADKNKVRVVVSMFGRETPVELELDQVEVVQP